MQALKVLIENIVRSLFQLLTKTELKSTTPFSLIATAFIGVCILVVLVFYAIVVYFGA